MVDTFKRYEAAIETMSVLLSPSRSLGNTKVTVVLMTYNHEKYIAEALESVLAQKAEFLYEVVVLEDCSTDHTRDILYDFQKRYPVVLRLVLAGKNQNNNIAWGREISNARSPYVALLDGDDYWTSPYKLQKQVTFLDSHPDFSMCFHGVTVFYEGRDRKPRISRSLKERLTFEDLIEADFMETCSIMLRRGKVTRFPDWWYTEGIGDWELLLFHAQHGDIGYIDEVMATYRKHSGGIYSGSTEVDRIESRLRMYHNVNRHLDFKYNAIIKNAMSRVCHDRAFQYAENGDWPNAKRYLKKSVGFKLLNDRRSMSRSISLSLRLFAPPVYKMLRKVTRFAA